MDILDLVKKYGAEIPTDQVENFNKDFRSSYKSAAEHKKLKDDLAAAQAKLSSNSDFEGKFNTLQKKYTEDIAAKQAEIDNMTFDTKLGKALTGIEFTSGRVKDSIVQEIKGKGFKFDDNGNIDGLNDYLKDLYKNEPNDFKSVDSEIYTWAGGSNNGSSNNDPDDKNYENIFGRCY